MGRAGVGTKVKWIRPRCVYIASELSVLHPRPPCGFCGGGLEIKCDHGIQIRGQYASEKEIE